MEATEAMLVAGLKETEPLGELVDWREGFGRAEMATAFEAMIAEAWQPIETAPKDGTRVLLYFPPPAPGWSLNIEGGRWQTDRYAKTPRPYWSGDNECMYGVRHYRDNQPTHWMPMLAPPSNAEIHRAAEGRPVE